MSRKPNAKVRPPPFELYKEGYDPWAGLPTEMQTQLLKREIRLSIVGAIVGTGIALAIWYLQNQFLIGFALGAGLSAIGIGVSRFVGRLVFEKGKGGRN